DVDLVPPLDRLEDDALADLADVVDAALRGRVHLDDVEGGAGRDRDARVARPVRVGRWAVRAVERLREDAREGRLAGPARPGEEVGLAHVPGRDRVPQRSDDRLLSDHVVEPLRTIFPVQRGQESLGRFYAPLSRRARGRVSICWSWTCPFSSSSR